MKNFLTSHKKGFIVFLVFIFVTLSLTLSYAMTPSTQGNLGKQTDHGVLLTWHKGVPHGVMHSLGRRGSGFCPQTRTTPKAPNGIYNQSNPLPATQKNIDAGMALYQIDAQPTACKICHGADGNGLGMMADGLNPKPRNFTCAETMKTITDGQMFWIIKNGSSGTGMPAYKDLAEEKIWEVILYLRKFAK